MSADVDPVTGRVGASMAGSIDLPISVNVYTGVDTSITNSPGTVPIFSGSTNVAVGYASVPARLLGPTVQGANAVFTLVGQYGSNYTIQVSTDQGLGWSPVQTVALTNGPAVISQPLSPTNLFYRAQLLP